MQPLSLNTQLRDYLLLFVACVLFHVLGTWNVPLIDRDEPRFAEASREMRERQDYIVPYFNNQYRFDKPPLTYWAQVASYAAFGENDFAARFPSTIAAALTALVIFACGSRMSGRTTGLWAAVMFTLSLQTFLHAKAAVADMWLVLFMTVAGWAGYELRGQRQTPNAQRSTFNAQLSASSVWWWVFYIALALAFLAKGPIGLLPLIPLIWIKLQSPRKAFYFSLGAGLLLTLGVICVWAVPALIQTQGEFWRVGMGRHVVGRSVGAMEGHGAKSFGLYLLLLPFYFVAVFVSFFPWSFKLPWLCSRLRNQYDSTDAYLLSGILVIFGVFTLVATKLPHYTLPAFPLLALLLARHWCVSKSAAADSSAIRWLKIMAIATASTWVACAIALPPFVARWFPSPSYVLFEESRSDLRLDMEFASVDYTEPSLVWYFRSQVKTFLTPIRSKNVADFMSKPGPRFVIVPSNLAADLKAGAENNWKTYSTQGFNVPKGKRVDLTLILKPE